MHLAMLCLIVSERWKYNWSIFFAKFFITPNPFWSRAIYLTNHFMDRKEFLSLIGIGSIGTALVCAGCSKSVNAGTTGPSSIDFSLNISDAANSALQADGGYLFSNNVLIARTTGGQFIAVQQFSLVYQYPQHRFYCDGHGGTFSESGTVIGGPPPRSLKTYNTSLNGNMLHIYSWTY